MKQIMSLKNKYLRYHTRSILLVDTLYNIYFLLFLLPFANHTLKLIMGLSKVSYITQENAVKLLTTPHAVFLLAVLLLVMLLFLQTKLSSLLYYCNTEGHSHRPPLTRIIYIGLFQTLSGLRRGRLTSLFFTLFYYFFLNLPVLFVVTLLIDPEFTHGSVDVYAFKGLLLLILISIALFSFEGIFAMHYYSNEHLSFRKAFQYSKALLKGRSNRTFRIILISNILLTLGFVLFYYGLLLLTALGAYFFADKNHAITVFLSAYPKISLYAALFYSMITFSVGINLTTSLFHSYQQEALQDILPDTPGSLYHFAYQSKKHRRAINSLIILLLIAGIFNLYYSIYHDSSYLNHVLTGVTISSHRGNSTIAPENTIPALESAILAGSDYAEIDVQQNKDGSLFLLHDKSLQRTAGLNEFIWELTDAQLNELDVGSWFSLEYLNTKLPTLEEVLLHCKDRIKLNIEIKITGKEQSMEKKLVALIEKYDYQDQCVVTSTNYYALKKVKKLNENIHTGLILSAVYGNFTNKEYLDFFSVRYNFINRENVTMAHKAGKEIYAWTVNTAREIERMKSLNVDCIITDYPSLAREVLYRDDTNDSFLQLIRRMLRHRSYYRLSQLFD
ncbi:MAG: glycerophosphoryl diester phosphodiesterase [Firmicutes bacterium]|nr:glycerophosphoryl diester phosphodiesterase [Bacillota bacterium]